MFSTKEKILKTGLKLWIEDSAKVTPSGIGKVLGVSHSLIIYHFPDGVRDAVAQYALDTDSLEVIGILIATKHPRAEALTNAQRKDYIQRIWG